MNAAHHGIAPSPETATRLSCLRGLNFQPKQLIAMKCFISYSHVDTKLKNQFVKFIRPICNRFNFTIFDDGLILPGQEWEDKIWNELNTSDIVFMLISIDFISSFYCNNIEYKKAQERHNRKEAIIIPIILRPCLWEDEPWIKYEAIPTINKTIVSITAGPFKNKDTAFCSVASSIRKLLFALNTKTSNDIRRLKPPNESDYKTTQYKAVFFDLDGTLIRGKGTHDDFHYSWQNVWKFLKYDDSVRQSLYNMYTSIPQQLSYTKWCEITTKLFRDKGLRREDFSLITDDVRLTHNCRETLSILRKKGIKTYIVSGGISTFLEHVFSDYSNYFDDVFINEFIYDKHGIICDTKTTDYDFEGKFDAITSICNKYGFKYSECVFIGEGKNDQYAAEQLQLNGGLTIGYPPNEIGGFTGHILRTDQLDAILALLFGTKTTNNKY